MSALLIILATSSIYLFLNNRQPIPMKTLDFPFKAVLDDMEDLHNWRVMDPGVCRLSYLTTPLKVDILCMLELIPNPMLI